MAEPIDEGQDRVHGEDRWRLSDWQLLAVVIAATLALFLCGMSWGMGRLGLFLAAVALVVVTWLGVFLTGLGRSGPPTVLGSARVLAAQYPPAGRIVGRCRMRLRVQVRGRSAVVMTHRDPAVPVIKWPWPGTILPVAVSSRRLRPLRVLWDSVQPHHLRSSASDQADTSLDVPFFTDYAVGVPSPPDVTGDGPTGSAAQPGDDVSSAPGSGGHADARMVPGAVVVDGEVVVAGQAEEINRAGHPGKPLALPAGAVPRPRSPDRPSVPPGVGMTIPVSNLARSLRLYRDLLGFAVVEMDPDTAVLAHGAGCILLRRVAHLPAADRRMVCLHVEVPDVERSYEELTAGGVDFEQPPQLLNPGHRAQLWAAVLLDPDRNSIALTQWREAPPSAPAPRRPDTLADW